MRDYLTVVKMQRKLLSIQQGNVQLYHQETSANRQHSLPGSFQTISLYNWVAFRQSGCTTRDLAGDAPGQLFNQMSS